MSKTRKVQVTLDEDQYAQLAEIARREDKKLARVVRESIVRYCLEPEVERKKREAVENLLAAEPMPVPQDYATWEAEYAELKTTDVATSDRGAEHSDAGARRAEDDR